jgi:hypothetical protein
MESLTSTSSVGVTEPTVTVLSCLTCKGRKVKCDKGQPSCSNCIRLAQLCTYPVHPMKPGPKSKHASSAQRSLPKHPTHHSHDKNGSKRRDKALISRRHSQQWPPTPTPSVVAVSKILESLDDQVKPITTNAYGDEAMKGVHHTSPSPSSTTSTHSRFEPYPLCIPGLSWIIHPSDYPNSVAGLDSPNKKNCSIFTHGDDAAHEESEESVHMETCQALHVTPETMGNM